MINVNNLSFSYHKEQTLFRQLDLDIPPGNIYGLLGKNGAGKTTLLRLIAGLLFPQEGNITVMGHQPQQRTPSFLSEIFFIPEEMHVPAQKVSDFEQTYAPFYPKFDTNEFKNHLREFEITDDKKMTDLSYGQKKKVMMSFGLATNCRLLILDEPTNGLDIPSKSQFRKLLAGAITDVRTFIISTHQVRDMANLIDPIIILEDSKILFQQSLEEITRKLHFELLYSATMPEGTLYSERVPGGYMVVTENHEELDSEVDVEVLFNTVISNKSKIRELFSNHQTLKQ